MVILVHGRRGNDFAMTRENPAPLDRAAAHMLQRMR
jgi:hypothetical protein